MDVKYESFHENKNHTTPDFPYNTYLCSIPLDFPEVHAHWHSEAELIVIKKGRGLVEVDLKSYEAEERDMILILPGQLHSIHQRDGFAMEYENILFEPSFAGADGNDRCAKLLELLFDGKLDHSTMINKSLPYYTEAEACIERIDNLCSRAEFGYQLGVKGALISLMHQIISHHSQYTEQTVNSRSIEKVKLILSYISQNYSQPITVQEAAAVCCYSCSHFMKFFKATMGESFTSYLCSYRLKIASQLLTSTSDSVLEIAINTGFSNLSYFNRQFKSKFGVTPVQYRKGQRKTAT